MSSDVLVANPILSLVSAFETLLEEPSPQSSISAHKQISLASTEELYLSLALMASKRLHASRIETEDASAEQKSVFYLSNEWLMGPQMDTALIATSLLNPLQALLGVERLQSVQDFARDLGLGNGGLGRLAACYIEAAAQSGVPMKGYGIWFRKGFFRQVIGLNGQQETEDDPWLETGGVWADSQDKPLDAHGNPIVVRFGGWTTATAQDPTATHPDGIVHNWVGGLNVEALQHDLPVASDDGKTVLTLRLWDVAPGFDSQHPLANLAYRIPDHLYPADKTLDGKTLRLMQEYFLVSMSVQDIIARHERQHGIGNLKKLDETAAMQLNDTHPALAIPELIRILHDERGMGWDEAKAITRKVCFYTNHTLAPEALETWERSTFGYILPRHLEIIEGLNNDLMEEFDAQIAADSREGLRKYRDGVIILDDRRVHMARMAAAFTKMTNGVSALHSNLVKKILFPGLVAIGRIFWNVTNGISSRRWLERANPRLASLLTETVGSDWRHDLASLSGDLAPRLNDEGFLKKLNAVKRANKVDLAALIQRDTGVSINTDALIDSQVKRFHGYKRQFLNILQIVALYQDILECPSKERPNIVKLYGGKAAPTYDYAKGCIAIINWLGKRINNDARVGDKLKLVFVPDYGVSKAQAIIAASDISEQISVAGMEASGTSNMKFSLNGAVTVGTRDGANIEIGAEAGEEHFFFFGHGVQEVEEIGNLSHEEYKQRFVEGDSNSRLRGALEFLAFNLARDDDPAIRDLTYMAQSILAGDDQWQVAADFNDFWDKQNKAHTLFQKPLEWARESLIQIRAGSQFSAVRSIKQYAEQWGVTPCSTTKPYRPAPRANAGTEDSCDIAA